MGHAFTTSSPSEDVIESKWSWINVLGIFSNAFSANGRTVFRPVNPESMTGDVRFPFARIRAERTVKGRNKLFVLFPPMSLELYSTHFTIRNWTLKH